MNTPYMLKLPVSLYTTTSIHIEVAKVILDLFPNDDVTIVLVHKKRFGTKLLQLRFTTATQETMIPNGRPGALAVEDEEEYVKYSFIIDGAIEDSSWSGDWDVYIYLGPYSRPKYAIKAWGAFLFKDPTLDTDIVSEQSFAVTKIYNYIFIGKIFTLDESELDSDDRLDAPGPEPEDISCFSLGYWINDQPWINEYSWMD